MTPSEAEEGRKPLPSMKSPPGEYDDVVFHLHHPAHPHPACELCRRRTAEVKLSTSRESLHDAAPHSVAPFTSSVTSLSASPPGHLPPAPPPDPSPPQPLAFPRPRCHTPRADPLLQPEDTFSRKTILLFNPSLFRDIGPFPHSSPARNATDAPAYHHAPPAPSASPPPRGTLALAPFQPAPNFLHLAAASQQGAAVSLPRWGREGKAGELHRQQQPLYSETLEDDLGQRYLQLFRHLLSLHGESLHSVVLVPGGCFSTLAFFSKTSNTFLPEGSPKLNHPQLLSLSQTPVSFPNPHPGPASAPLSIPTPDPVTWSSIPDYHLWGEFT
ncbi:spermatogenesis-associated protein 31D3-like isoform X1 [Lemur catta]|uniref:spermatogenesis-associated protein 31D3-like isoform X1 n=1 Tax=Lemur catta TaxID=9447 RepID=UPI001E26E641|nr:spermatogenesis-associated protein 31D3-like isoform X1 [Lemur catta]